MHFQLEDRKPFSRSLLWQLQRQYFEEMGFEAWRRGEVPHYVTSNPRIANSYAEMIFAFYKDALASMPVFCNGTCMVDESSARAAVKPPSRTAALSAIVDLVTERSS